MHELTTTAAQEVVNTMQTSYRRRSSSLATGHFKYHHPSLARLNHASRRNGDKSVAAATAARPH
ncbi:unnamed protein product [Ceratitis capitata]|uniref:(Mediterranean fruit fly) hypothetical protein n=1 Tax=Ceratitis capitata TaxID=7213 RepID=A0A811UJH9_CERCA|nr:unnamed protein product [Ceratitis capitata]